MELHEGILYFLRALGAFAVIRIRFLRVKKSSLDIEALPKTHVPH
jgi:hypothetical protein